MQWLISLLGLGVLLAVAVLTRARPAPSYRDAPLEDELISHIAALAARLGRGGEGRLRAPRGMLGLFTRQIGFLAQCPADDLLPAARWLSDNGRYLQEMTAALKRELKGMPALPKTEKGEVRVLCLARELTGHTSAELTQELVLRAAEAWQKSEPLTTAELCALPAALKVALFQVLCEMTLQSAREQRAHNAAAPFARRLLEGRVSARVFEQYKNNTVFLERLFSLLRAGEDQQAIEWLDQHVGERAEIARNELARQTENRLWVGNAITSLRMISRAPWDRLCEQMSLVHQALCEDEVYPRMDEESRAYYREKVATLARLARKSEQSICELALVLAARPELESVETHVGYYLLDCGVPALLSTLPARDARLRLWTFGGEHAFGLLRLSGWLCFALLLGLASAIALPWALWLPFALVFLQPFDRCWALLCQRFVRPRLVPRMRVDALKERTLVVCPTLLNDREHALQMIRHLSVLQQANPDPMLHYMLLGDFGDSLTQSASGDEEIIATAATAVQALCDDTQRRFFYLQRNRALSPVEHLYMSRERKRGGLETLLKIVQGQPIEDTFAYCSCPRGELEGKYRYVITLDSDTFLPPGSALRLIGAMSHPLQKRQMAHGKPRGVSVLQPRMEVATHTVGSYLSLLLGGRGGSDSYHLLASDFMQDLAGRGSFVGKGIIDPEPFLQAMEGSILPHMVLSHDLLEGELAGCKSITDVTLYDGEPATLRAFLGRLHRWTRGDWQLLPYLLPLPGYAHSARLDAVARHKLWMNLRRSLAPVLRFVLMACAVALGRPWLLLLCLWELPWPLTKLGWLTQLTRLALLPCEAFMRADAMARTLWRLLVSRRGLLQWTTAAQLSRPASKPSMLYWDVCFVAGGLVGALSFVQGALLAGGLLLAALWLAFPALLPLLEQPYHRPQRLTGYMREELARLASETYLYFDTVVTDEEHHLPPDNIQLEPNKGVAHRTSPTNIGLYLTSLIAAEKLGLLAADEMARRIRWTVETLEALPKWNGHLYNWYDTRTLSPLQPLFVSSVDSGNLAVCLLCCAQGLRVKLADLPASDRALSGRLDALAESMRFDLLFDWSAELFGIGVHPGQPMEALSHYDLLASESRLLSFVAIMLGQAPVRHWHRLSRSMTRTRAGRTLVSYSGTMFEYMMPLLFLPPIRGTLLHDACAAALREQRAWKRMGAFGVSESGYFAFDPNLYYQYKAFGIPALAMDPIKRQDVIAPYASILALPIDARAAFLNLKRMEALGWESPLGLFEAADFQKERIGARQPFRVVRSHMSHHQGMILCALCNALCGGYLAELFFGLPRAQAFTLLLEEKPQSGRSVIRHPLKRREPEPAFGSLMARRSASPCFFPVDAHLLHGAGTTLLIDAQGGGYIARDGVMGTRFHESCALASGPRFYLRDSQSGACWSLTDPTVDGGTEFETAQAVFTRGRMNLETTLRAFVGPLDGAALHLITLRNTSSTERMVELCSYLEPALAPQREDAAHPAFQNLFIRTSRIGAYGVMATRRPREEKQEARRLMHLFSATGTPTAFQAQTDRMLFLGRGHTPEHPQALAMPISASREIVGDVIEPCLSLRAQFVLPAGGQTQCLFATLIAAPHDAPAAFCDRYATPEAALKLYELAQTQGLVTARYLGMDAQEQCAASRLCGSMVYTGQPHQHSFAQPGSLPLKGMWGLGLSGDLPMLLALIDDAKHLPLIRLLLKAHAWYRMSGLWCDLVVICDQLAGYEHPLRDAVNDLFRASPSGELTGREGGLHLLERQSLDVETYGLLLQSARIVLDASKGELQDQLRALLIAVRPRPQSEAPMPESRQRALTPLELRFANGFGGFSPSDGSYVITLPAGQTTPAPWSNVLANPRFGSLTTESGIAFTYAGNSHQGRLTRWPNDAVTPRGEENFFIKEHSGGQLWSPTRWPLGQRAEHRVTHGFGVTQYESRTRGVYTRLSVFTDSEHSAGLRVLQLRNENERECRLTVYHTCVFGMAETPGGQQLTRISRTDGVLWAVNPAMPGVACLCMLDPEPTLATTMSAGMFQGLSGDAPFALTSGDALPCDAGNAAVLCRTFTLLPGETAQLTCCIGWGESQEELGRVLALLRRDGATLRLHLVRQFWENELGRLGFDLPDEALSVMLNRWLPYQRLAARLYARAGFYQAGGAIGFRDQLQDMLSLLHTNPGRVRSHLLECAAHQFEEGDVQHWWHPPRLGVRTRISDDLLFLPFVTARYVRVSGDAAVLFEEAPYLSAPPLKEDERERFEEARESELAEPLWKHCLRAIDHVALGPRGLPLMGGGDWNDGMNRVGGENGESVWLGMFLCETLRLFAPLCDAETAKRLEKQRDDLLRALDRHAWDGGWYLRGWYDDGEPLGSARNEECRIDVLSQSWAVLAGTSRERAGMAMDAVWRTLYEPDAGLLKLFAPPFDGREQPGYIAGYLPGIRENGGQYTHAVPWAIAALHQLGRDEQAWQLTRAVLPVNHALTRAQAARYRVEPYVMAADVYANPQQRGRGGWTWYTGSASWLYAVVLEQLLGFHKAGNALWLRPAVPPDWTRFSITYRFGGSTYHLHAARDCPFAVADGEKLTDGRLILLDDGRIHEATFPIRS